MCLLGCTSSEGRTSCCSGKLCAGCAVAGPRAHAAAAHAHAILVSFTRFRSPGCARAAGALELRPPRLLRLHPELFCAPLDGLSRLQDDEKERDTTENLLERADVEDILELKAQQQEDEKLKASAVLQPHRPP